MARPAATPLSLRASPNRFVGGKTPPTEPAGSELCKMDARKDQRRAEQELLVVQPAQDRRVPVAAAEVHRRGRRGPAMALLIGPALGTMIPCPKEDGTTASSSSVPIPKNATPALIADRPPAHAGAKNRHS